MLDISNSEYQKYRNFFGVVYMIRDRTNGKIYVGQTTNIRQRIRQYRYESKKIINRHMNRAIYKAIYEKGLENFDFIILEGCSSIDELNECEIKWIEKLKSNDQMVGYNEDKGGKNYINRTVKAISKEKIEKMRIPIVVKIENKFFVFPSAKSFAELLNIPRTHVTRGARRGIRVRGYFIFYFDKEKCHEVIENLKEDIKNGRYKKLSDVTEKMQYIKLGEELIRRNVEIIERSKEPSRVLTSLRAGREAQGT